MVRIVFVFFLSFTSVFAENNLASEIIDIIEDSTWSWISTFEQAAMYLFGVLALIGLTLEASFKALSGELEFGSIMTILIRNVLIFGLFLAFIEHDWLDIIFDSFLELGNDATMASGVSMRVSFDTITDMAVKLLGTIADQQSITSPISSVMLGLIGLYSVVLMLFAGLALLTSYVKFLLLSAVAPIFLALGVLSHTRHWAMSSITAILKAGLEYMLTVLILGLSISTMQNYAGKAMSEDGSLFALFIVSTLVFGLSKIAQPLAESLFSGTMSANPSIMSPAAVSAAVGGAAGAAGGAAAGVKAASAHVQAAKEGGQGTSMMGNMRTVASGALGGMMGGAYEGARGNGMGAAKMRGEQVGSFGAADPRQKSKEFAQKVKSVLAGSAPAQKNDSGTSGTIGGGRK